MENQKDLTAQSFEGIVGLEHNVEMNYVPTANKKAVQKAMRAIGGTGSDMFVIDPDLIKVMPNFNPRIKDDIYWEGIRVLKEGMRENGFYEDRPIGVILINNEPYAIEGGRRRDAAILLKSEMDEETAKDFVVPVVVKSREISELDLNYGLGMANEHQAFRPFEYAVLFRRLSVVFKQSNEQILKRYPAVSPKYLDDLLIVSGAPQYIVELLVTEQISVTLAADLMRKHGGEAVGIIKATHANAKSAGKERITARFMPGAVFKKSVSKKSTELYSLSKSVVEDPAFTSLNEETQEKLRSLIDFLKNEEVSEQVKAAEEEEGDENPASSDAQE